MSSYEKWWHGEKGTTHHNVLHRNLIRKNHFHRISAIPTTTEISATTEFPPYKGSLPKTTKNSATATVAAAAAAATKFIQQFNRIHYLDSKTANHNNFHPYNHSFILSPLNATGILSINQNQNYNNYPSNNNEKSLDLSVNGDIDDQNWVQSGSLLALIIIYGLVVFGGVLGNASLVVTLYSQSSVRLRNPLLVALCIADLLVAGISAPSTIATLALTQKSWTIPSIGCKIIYYFQSMPVAASTLSFLMLSLDRYATVKHPRLAQLRQRRYVHSILAILSWIGASAICIPILFAYHVTSITYTTRNKLISSTPSAAAVAVSPLSSPLSSSSSSLMSTSFVTSLTSSSSSLSSPSSGLTSSPTVSPFLSSQISTLMLQQQQDHQQQQQQHIHHSNYMICRPDYGSTELQTSFIIVHTILVFIFPGLGVILNHYGVRRKLCALSLTARAAHGELPLPMPILRRPTHMIIVTGMANAARGVVSDGSCSEDDDEGNNGGGGVGGGSIRRIRNGDQNNINGEKNLMMETIIKTSPKSPRVMREIRVQQQRQKLEGQTPGPGIPLPQTSTLRSRRRLANMLVAAAIIFIGCWTPHVFCVLWSEFGHKEYCSKTMSYFSLLLGYTHSAISPIMYWTLNHNTLRQSPCAPFIRISAIQRFLRTHLRSPAAPPPPSSTNEAALGPFHPRYIKTTPKQYRAQASSHYLY